MVSVDKAVIAKLKSHNQTFEILVDCDNAIALKGGKEVAIEDVVASDKIFVDAKKGEEASEVALKQVFDTIDVTEVIRKIIQKGEIQLTQEYREKLRETKKRQIIDTIHRNGVDPRTHSPHPPQRIEAALEEAKIHFDEFKDVNTQVQDALKKLITILPIKFEIKEIAVKISPEYAPKCYNVVRNFGTLLKEEWLNTGYFTAVIEIPGGLEEEFYDQLNKITHGNVETVVIKTK
tara:strand:- start:20675 stop:21376 length:702 start_codon:yes stop_codon:yes gene_type:complete